MAHSDRKEYLTATALDQDLLDRLQDNLEFKLEMICDIETPSGTIRASDRNKFVDGVFYQALTEFPVVKRSLGEWLEPTIEFSRLTISVSNVDGRYNNLLPGGADYAGWINKRLTVKMGLSDLVSTYSTVYSGLVTSVGGLQRDRSKITLLTRDDFERANVNFPNTVLNGTGFPNIEDDMVGTTVPVIYGDFTVSLKKTKLIPDDPASPVADVPIVPAFPVNGKDPNVVAGTTNVQLVVSENNNAFLDTAQVYLQRSDSYYLIDSSDVVLISGNRLLEIKQGAGGGATLVDGAAYQYASGDKFFVAVRGKDLAGYNDNIISQARDILKTYGGILDAEFDATWDTYRDKSSPAQSAISTFKSRVWVQEQQGVMQYVLSMLEQVRLEAFPSRALKFKLISLHFEDFPSAPAHTIRNWDIEEGTFNPQLDDRNVWNRARADYAFDPSQNENAFETAILRNSAAITQTGKEISKKVVFPNLYEEATVILQLTEMLRLASSSAEFIEATLTPRSALKDLGDFVLINVRMGSTILENVPAMIREIGYDPRGLRIPVKLWSFQMISYPGYSPAYPKTAVGGHNAVITTES